MSDVTLTGYHLSVYTWAARMALAAKGVRFGTREIDPFEPENREAMRKLHPFGKVPVLEHDGFRVYETQAIMDYVDGAFDGPALTPVTPKHRARMRQVMGIVDSYVFQPLVLGVFVHRVYRPLVGESVDEAAIAAGLETAGPVLDALEEIAAEEQTLVPGRLCLDTCLLWPMLGYFRMAPEGAEMMSARPALAAWAAWAERCDAARESRPELPEGADR